MQQIGIYEQLITQLLDRQLHNDRFYVKERELSTTEAAEWLSRFLTRILRLAIDSVPNGDDRLQQQIHLANQLLLWLKQQIQDQQLIDNNLVHTQGRILQALFDRQNPIASELEQYVDDIFPLAGLTQSELFCGSNAGLSLDSEIKREILSSNTIYWLVSFIKWTGIRIFRHELETFTRRGGQLKVITTSYMGATDAKAVEFLANLPNTEVKLSYNTERERLHAKSYMFLRETGFHTGYIGSSNLSHSALTSGLEWNLKITSKEIPHIIEKSINTFETYWSSRDFTLFENNATCQQQLRQALNQARGGVETEVTSFFDLKPFPHQNEILEQLEVQRQIHGHYRNLVVAATGTGKTLISAFDFARFLEHNPQAKFLFIAHREEILKQAQHTYRVVLRNGQFGQLWVSGQRPDHYAHLFASIQSMNNQIDNLSLSEDYYDYIVIDEVHHIAASSYRSLLNKFRPKILLGLTATPERHDGSDILGDFCGVIGAQIRLPEAINQGHLCPFQYFGIDDDTDLRSISWARGRYDIAQLSNLYTHNDVRVQKILASMQEILSDRHQMCALAFCVSQEHAEYMAKQFNLHGIAADYLTSANSQERQHKQQSLRRAQIQILCVVDIFNEGVDIPEIDTLLFLRPTESLTIFLQQLGRGLRRQNNKECCTILDFVGNSRPEYDFSTKFRALVGRTSRSIVEEISQGFPHAPLGCRIELSKRTQTMILQNIRSAIRNKSWFLGMIRQFSQHSEDQLQLANFLKLHPQLDINLLYKCGCWSGLVDQAFSCTSLNETPTAAYRTVNKAVYHRLLASDDHQYLLFLKQLIEADFKLDETDPLNQHYALMCHYDFWQKTGPQLGFNSLSESMQKIKQLNCTQELLDLIAYLLNQTKHQQASMPDLPQVNLRLHARYTREQILVGFSVNSFTHQMVSREGVYRITDQNIELMFVTLNKNERHFSPTTMYHDYALNHELFHWQSQNSATPDSGMGLSYIEHRQRGKRLFLFIRESSRDEYGRTMGFVNYGEVDYVRHSGAKPMNITWKLKTPMPSFMWQHSAKLAVG